MNFDKAFDRLLGHEGGFVDHPRDPGGATRWGITQRVARAYGYAGDMRSFPVTDAKRIARTDYWDAVRADEMPDAVRFDLSMRPTTPAWSRRRSGFSGQPAPQTTESSARKRSSRFAWPTRTSSPLASTGTACVS